MTDTIVTARWLVRGVIDRHTVDIVDNGAVLHRDGIVVETGSLADLQKISPGATVSRYDRHLIVPGFVNAHHHVGLTPLQQGFSDEALEYWFAVRLNGREIDFYLDALYSAFEMIETGTTTVQHIQGWMLGDIEDIHAIASDTLRAYRDIGMRASYCWAARQINHFVYEDNTKFADSLPAELRQPMKDYLRKFEIPFQDNFRLFELLREETRGDDRIAIQLAPGNLHWLTDDQLLELNAFALSAGVPMHMHLVETMYQQEYARRRGGKTALQHLHRLGILGEHLTLGHCVWFTPEDIEITADTKTCICHNCSSNLRLRSGVAPVNRFEAKGITTAIGLDEAGINDDRDMLQEMRMVLRLHRTPGMDDSVPTPAQVFRMATSDGARTTPFRDQIGELRPGMQFDAAMIDFDKATFPYQDEDIPPLDVIVQRARANAVEAVFVAGERIYVDGRFTRVDRNAVLDEMRRKLSVPRLDYDVQMRRLGKAVRPHVKAFYDGYVAGEPRS